MHNYTCPDCGSSKTKRLSIFHKQTSSGGGGGCSGCLLFLLLLIFAPGIVIFGGIATGATIYALRKPLLIALIISAVIGIIVHIYRKNTFICERCGHKFRP